MSPCLPPGPKLFRPWRRHSQCRCGCASRPASCCRPAHPRCTRLRYAPRLAAWRQVPLSCWQVRIRFAARRARAPQQNQMTPQKSHQPHRRARCWKKLWAHWPQSLRRGRWVAAIRSNPPHPVLSGQAPRRCRGQCGRCWPDHAGRPDFSAVPRGRSARPRRRRPLPPAGRRPAPAQSPCPARIFGSVPSFVTPIHVCVRFVLVVVCDGWRTFIHKNIRHRGAMTDLFVCV